MKKLFISILVFILLPGGVYLFRKKQTVQASAPPGSQAVSSKTPQFIDLLESDISTAQKQLLTQTLPVNGTVKATESATVKAKVSGDIKHVFVKEG